MIWLVLIVIVAVLALAGWVGFWHWKWKSFHVVYVFMDLSASVVYTPHLRDKIVNTASDYSRRFGARLWAFSNEAWPVNTHDDLDPQHRKCGGTDIRAVLDVIGEERAIVVTDGAFSGMLQTMVPDNVYVITVNV